MPEKKKKRPVKTNFNSCYFVEGEDSWMMMNHLTLAMGYVKYDTKYQTHYFVTKDKQIVSLDFAYVRDLAIFMGLLEKRKAYDHRC